MGALFGVVLTIVITCTGIDKQKAEHTKQNNYSSPIFRHKKTNNKKQHRPLIYNKNGGDQGLAPMGGGSFARPKWQW